jgi:L-aspartate oxidase
VQKALIKAAHDHPNVTMRPHSVAIDLVTDRHRVDGHGEAGMGQGETGRRVWGVYALDAQSGKVECHVARSTILATGGAGRTYLFSTAPRGATGDGIAMAWRAGARVSNMEFMQFHPTCLYHPEAKNFLISEAVRGEGGRLLLPNGERFMPRFDERAELAPRDIVARAIDHEMKRLGVDCVYLDISHQPAAFIEEHFPTILSTCLKFGIDMRKQPMPVVPATHYTCGGVMTDRKGRTDVPGLYAVGEVAFTGLHGANRMASNSLLECLVYGAAAAEDIRARLPDLGAPPPVPAWDETLVINSDEEVVVSHNWDELRRFMWDYVGIVRTTKRLERAQHRIEMLLSEIDDYYGSFRVTGDLLELRNLAMVAKLIIRSALSRKESRGLHYSLDFPYEDSVGLPQNTILVPKRFRPLAP